MTSSSMGRGVKLMSRSLSKIRLVMVAALFFALPCVAAVKRGFTTLPSEDFVRSSVRIDKVFQMFPWSNKIVVEYTLLQNSAAGAVSDGFNFSKSLVFSVGANESGANDSETVILGSVDGSTQKFNPTMPPGVYRATIELPVDLDASILTINVTMTVTQVE